MPAEVSQIFVQLGEADVLNRTGFFRYSSLALDLGAAVRYVSHVQFLLSKLAAHLPSCCGELFLLTLSGAANTSAAERAIIEASLRAVVASAAALNMEQFLRFTLPKGNLET